MIPLSHETNTKLFITAVIHWLSSFPSSTIDYNEPFEHFCRPLMITLVLRLLIDDSFAIDVDFTTYKTLNAKLLITNDDVEEYESIFQSVKQIFKERLWSRRKLFKYLDIIKFESLSKGDLFAIATLCLIFVEIGLHSSKNGIAISTISMLDECDQKEMKMIMYDDQDLSGRNMVLMQSVHLLESENADLKQRNHINERELLKLKKEPYSSQLEKQFEELIQMRDSEITKLKQEVSSLKQLNKDLKNELNQLNEDLLVLGSLHSPSQASPNKSPKKRSTAAATTTTTTTTASSLLTGIMVSNTTELDLIKWESNILNDWICLTFKCGDRDNGRCYK